MNEIISEWVRITNRNIDLLNFYNVKIKESTQKIKQLEEEKLHNEEYDFIHVDMVLGDE